MAFMMFRITCKFCAWSVALTREEDASYSQNFFATHLNEHVAEIVAELDSDRQ